MHFLLKIPETSIESPDNTSKISRWSREVSNTNLRLVCSKSRLQNLKYENIMKMAVLSTPNQG